MITVQEQHTLKALENFCSKANKRLSEIDWEQRRYEIAKEIFVREADGGWNSISTQAIAEIATRKADILIEQLKNTNHGI